MRELEHEGRRLIVLAGRSGSPSAVLLSSSADISSAKCSVRLLNAGMVFGNDHILSAFHKAARAFSNDQNVSDSLATETMLYMSGCRQIQEAVELFDLKKGDGAIVCIADFSEEMERKLRGGLKIEEDESVLAVTCGKDPFKFGVGKAEAGTVPGEKAAELVLERVASVDIKKK